MFTRDFSHILEVIDEQHLIILIKESHILSDLLSPESYCEVYIITSECLDEFLVHTDFQGLLCNPAFLAAGNEHHCRKEQ